MCYKLVLHKWILHRCLVSNLGSTDGGALVALTFFGNRLCYLVMITVFLKDLKQNTGEVMNLIQNHDLQGHETVNLMGSLDEPHQRHLRKLVISCILATDMGLHAEILGHFTTRLADPRPFEMSCSYDPPGPHLAESPELVSSHNSGKSGGYVAFKTLMVGKQELPNGIRVTDYNLESFFPSKLMTLSLLCFWLKVRRRKRRRESGDTHRNCTPEWRSVTNSSFWLH